MSSPSRIQHPLRAEKRGTFNQKIFPRQPQNTIFRTFSLPPDFSTHWKHFFQSLENSRKIFPIIGKTAPIFPTIGNIFSNHWKTPPPALPRQNPCDFPCAGMGRAGSPRPPEQGTPKHGRHCADAHFRSLPAGWHPPIQWHPMTHPGIRRRGNSPPYPLPPPSSHPLPRPSRDTKENRHISRVFSPLHPP